MKKTLCAVLCILMLMVPTVVLAQTHAHTDHVGWSSLQLMNTFPTTSGKYVLQSDATIRNNPIYPADGTMLCLNGHSITQTTSGVPVIVIPSGFTFTLCDCQGTGKITHADGAKGGGVKVDGTFNMEGGVITGNAGSNGGGVYVTQSGKFTMSGGSITGNTADEGGGVHISRGGLSDAFTMSGGSITDNTSKGSSGGVYLDHLMGMTVSGDAVISGNSSLISGTAKPRNVFLFYSVITVGADGLKSPASIGLTANASVPEQVMGVNETDYSAYFFADNKHEKIVYRADDNTMWLEENHTWVWRSNATKHWQFCNYGNCYETTDKEPHVMPSGAGCTEDVVCTVCSSEVPSTVLHNYAYTLSGATITEACDKGCNHRASVMITAPTGELKSDGSTSFDAKLAYTGTLADGNNLTISYRKDGVSVTDTKSAGTYTASVTLGGKTATVTYEVKAAEVVVPEVPKTGDSATPLTWALMLVISCACAVMLKKSRRAA